MHSDIKMAPYPSYAVPIEETRDATFSGLHDSRGSMGTDAADPIVLVQLKVCPRRVVGAKF